MPVYHDDGATITEIEDVIIDNGSSIASIAEGKIDDGSGTPQDFWADGP